MLGSSNACEFQIRFWSATPQHPTLCFPCDARGNVDLDRLTEADRREYLFARIMTRREGQSPEVCALS
jgi:hypothetical protein